MELKYYKDKNEKGKMRKGKKGLWLMKDTALRLSYMPLWAHRTRTTVNYSETDGVQT